MLALIDGDILVYRCAFAAEKTIYTLVDPDSGVPFGRFESAAERRAFIKREQLEDHEYETETEVEVEPLRNALANVESVLTKIKQGVGTDDVRIFLSHGQCFRHNLATIQEYKGNRKEARKPEHYIECRDTLIEAHGAIPFTAIEADDALAIAQQDESTVIVSIDKDLLQVPGFHYNWVKGEKYCVTPVVGLRKLYMQVLTGDSTDNIPGIFRMGEKTARGLITPFETEYEMLGLCENEWYEFLESDLKKPMADLERHDEEISDVWQYRHWNEEDTIVKTTLEIVDEIHDLVKVGGVKAIEAAQEANEEIPLS
jgi:hypothetical protein